MGAHERAAAIRIAPCSQKRDDFSAFAKADRVSDDPQKRMHRVRKPQTPKSDPPPDTPDTGATALKPYRHTTIQACTWSDKTKEAATNYTWRTYAMQA